MSRTSARKRTLLTPAETLAVKNKNIGAECSTSKNTSRQDKAADPECSAQNCVGSRSRGSRLSGGSIDNVPVWLPPNFKEIVCESSGTGVTPKDEQRSLLVVSCSCSGAYRRWKRCKLCPLPARCGVTDGDAVDFIRKSWRTSGELSADNDEVFCATAPRHTTGRKSPGGRRNSSRRAIRPIHAGRTELDHLIQGGRLVHGGKTAKSY